ncbi:MAG: PIG-L deacetylase family protein [Sphaerochaeta sp.]|uniref:PIG-L deacetylase family protein n=1 Tax=Sphaerochaeta sp. TaxID=1972642 RepID=UPI002FCB3057
MFDPKQNVLVVSGHAADYVWRAGGTIAKYLKHGAQVKVVVLSLGVRGESNDLWNKPNQTYETVAAIRKSESLEAASKLGITDIEFWDYEDYYMALDDEAKLNRMAALIRTFRPHHIITHGDLDLLNPDHDAVNAFVFKASVLAISNGVPIEGTKTSTQTRIFGFEPHQSEICNFKPEVIIDISETMEMKVAAMHCFKAQSHLIEYYTQKACMRGNHARRLSGNKTYAYAEAFTRRFPYVGEWLV